MAKNFFKRYIWLIDLIRRHSYISFADISREWQRSHLNDTGEPLSERTFFNHKAAINDIFGIEIKNDRSLGFYIAGSDDMDGDATAAWMLHALCFNNVLQENADMKDRIVVDRVPSGERFLTEVISAMRSGMVVSLTYNGFNRSSPTNFLVRPYCVKYFKQRWYMLGLSELGLRVYALDRFVDMEEVDETYSIPADFDAEQYFSNYFGVIVGEDPEDVYLRVDPGQAKYFRTLPLHHSQKEIENTDCIPVSVGQDAGEVKHGIDESILGDNQTVKKQNWPVFSYHIAPTFDFVQEILSRGSDVEVLAPESLRNAVAGVVGNMHDLYHMI